jgi:hypothetical protein
MSVIGRSTAEFDRRDALCVTSSALIAFGIYTATMYPGLVGIGDTPKLQFVGAVLGTPHSPGYPLYVWLSWIFSRLPLGSTVAFRVNLLSAVCSGAAIGILSLVLRELGCRRLVAFAGALAIAFGRLFWSQSLLAEVYALNVLLFGGVLLFLLRWSRSRRFGDLAWALVFFAAGLAHHLTLAMTAPALLAFALMVDPHVVTTRTLRAAIVACVAGLSCYLFVWVRTHQHAPFLEVRANTLSDLVGIVSARQFSPALFRFSFRELVVQRAPLVSAWLMSELRWGGVAAAAIGAMWLAYGRRRDLVLLAGSAAAVMVFALNYDVYDVQVFLIIPMVAFGLLAGVGLEALCRAAQAVIRRGEVLTRTSEARPGVPRAAVGRLLTAAASAAVLILPLTQFRANFKVNNHRGHTFEAQYFDALFKALPPRSAIVAESYTIDHMVLYKLLAEDGGRGRRIEVIPADAGVVRRYVSSGFAVFAFSNGRSELQFDVPFADADLSLPRAPGVKQLAETEAQQLAYPLSVVTLDLRGTAGTTGAVPDRAPEPMTGAVWRPTAQ